MYLKRSVVSCHTALTVDTICVVTATDTDSAPSVLAVDVQAESLICYSLIEVAFFCFPVAVTL